jgi:hypothetical protein
MTGPRAVSDLRAIRCCAGSSDSVACIRRLCYFARGAFPPGTSSDGSPMFDKSISKALILLAESRRVVQHLR